MLIKPPSRKQRFLLPPSIEEFVGPQHRVRGIVEVVEQLDLSGFATGSADVGRSAYPPAAMVSTILYAFSSGVFSSREIARRCETDLAYMFAASGLKPSYRTFSRFREDNSAALSEIYGQVVRVCLRAGLGDMSVVAIDGSPTRANASFGNHEKRTNLEKQYEEARSQFLELVERARAIDSAEASLPDDPTVPAALAAAKERASAIQRAIAELGDENERNTTDPDCRLQRFKEGNRPGYRTEIAVASDGLILAADVVADAADSHQLIPMVDQMRENTGNSAGVVVADAGYESGENIRELVERNQDAVIAGALGKAASKLRETTGLFQSTDFHHDPTRDEYVCPANRRLVLMKTIAQGDWTKKIYEGVQCADCPLRPQCTTKDRRTLSLNATAPYVEAMSERRKIDRSSQKVLAKRQGLVEHHFGHFKHNLRWRYFLHRGLQRCRADFRLLCSAFNITKRWTQLTPATA